MKKSLVLVFLLVLIQVSSTLALAEESKSQLSDVFAAVVNVEEDAAAGDWGAAQRKVVEIKSIMLEIAPSVQQAVGIHAYKAINGFIVQLQQALLAEDRAAAKRPLVSLQKMNGWLEAQYPRGI